MLSTNLKLAWHLYQQEKQYPYQRFLSAIQIILMVFIITLSQTSHSIQTFLTQNLNNLLGADLVISQQNALNNQQKNTLADMSEQLVVTRHVRSTITHNDTWQRATLKAVGDGYPLQGNLRISHSLQTSNVAVNQGPAVGEIWLDSRLLASLSLEVGDMMSIAERQLRVTAILQHEPDRLMEGHNVDMRALINTQDLSEMNFAEDIVNHRYLFEASAGQIDNILSWQKDNLPAAQVHHKQGAHPLALFWKRTENFIGLASIILFFMAAIAIQQLTQVQIKKEQYFTAICLSLGASKATGLQISLVKWLLRLAFIAPVVFILSAVFHWLFIEWLTSTFAGLKWQWHFPLALKTFVASAVIFLVFHLPVWLGLRQSSVMQLIQNSKGHVNTIISLGCALLVLTAVAVVYSDNGLLTAMVLGSMGVCIALIMLISWLALSLGEWSTKNVSGLMPFALYMMKQRLLSKTTQILGVGLCAFLLLFTLMLLRDLGGQMSAYQRQHDGNLLVSRASDVQMQDIAAWSEDNGVEIRQSKPFMYAKLTKVNGQHLTDFTSKPSDSLATFNSPIRLHWTDPVPANNRVAEGQWWTATDSNWQQISVEQEVMTDLGLTVGDRLTFFIHQQSVEFEIAASHVL